MLQTKLTVGASSDRHEQEANRVAEQVLHMPTLQLQHQMHDEPQDHHNQTRPLAAGVTPLGHRNGGVAAPAVPPTSVHEALQTPGRPLSSSTRAFMEPRFGADFRDVRLHTGPAAERAAAQVHARAFTVGTDVWLGRGETESDRRLMAHELTHTIQQTKTRSTTGRTRGVRSATPTGQQTFTETAPGGHHARQGTVMQRQLRPDMCASVHGTCDTLEGTDGVKGGYKLTVYADKEGAFLGIPFTHNVGHSWVRLKDEEGRYWSYGFWPQRGYDAGDTSKDVEGCVHSPDGESGNPPHTPTSSQTFKLTAEEFAAAHSYAIGVCRSNPKYNLFGLQCTEFVRRVLEAAGQSPSLGFGLIWESPNALDAWMRRNELLLGLSVTGATSAPGNRGRGDVGAEISYTHQFYALLGNKLRLHWMSRGELSQRKATISTGVGAELTSQRVFLPSAYVFGGGIAGEMSPGTLGGGDDKFGAGLTVGTGLLFDVDELATVGVEYNLVKDLVHDDPELRRLMFRVSIPLY